MDNIQSGQTIGPYTIIEQVGQGGMAAVYKAYQPAMERYVALKILPRQLAESPEFTGRFQQEARTIAHLEHAHILPVHDYGTSQGYTYLAMRYVEGGTLSDRLQSQPPTAAEIDRWLSQLADALDYAHAQGVVHRDLKPANVLLDTRGDLFLTDFGIARLLEADKRFTSSGSMIGTPAYMSPEQGMGQLVDRRTDIYSLGIMLYEMVTGRLPFDADTPLAIVLKQINEPLPLPSKVNPSISPAVEQVLLKALAKDPEARYATAGQFNAAWQSARRATLLDQAAPATRNGAPAPPGSSASLGRLAGAAAPQGPADAPARPPSGAGPAPATARRSLSGWPLLLAGAVLVAAVVVCGAALAALALRQQGRANPGRGTPPASGSPVAGATTPSGAATPTGAAIASSATAPTAAAGGSPIAGQWRSWSAANNVVALTLFNGQLVSGGPGGITRWNLADGSQAGRLTTGNGLPDPDVHALLVDKQAKLLWIATSQGAVSYDGQTTHVYDRRSGLDSSSVTSLALTKRGLLAGTSYSGAAGGGLNLFDGNRWQPMTGFPSSDNDTAADQVSANVSALLEDSHGDWWVGTSNGLARYDGQSWTRYTTDDGLPDNEIIALAEAGGSVWVGTYQGVAQFDGSTFASLPQAKGHAAYGVFQSTSGDLWLAGEGGLLRRPASGDWQTYDSSRLPATEVTSGLEAPGGILFFGSNAGVLRFDGQAFDQWAAQNAPSQAGYRRILTGPTAGSLWFVANYSNDTDVVNLAGATWKPWPQLPCDGCAPMAWAPDGRLWAGSSDGMWVFKDTQATHIASNQGLPSGTVRSVAFAPDGSTWIGTDAGAAVYSGAKVTAVYTTSATGLTDDDVNHLLAAADGSVWVAADVGLSRHTPDGQWVKYGQGNPFQNDQIVTGLAQDASGAVWATTEGEGVYRFANNVWAQFRPGVGGVRLPSSEVLCVTAASDGSVWFGTNGAGAARFDGANWQAFTVADGLVDGSVNDIYRDSSGTVWFATNGGVSALKP